MRRRRLADVAAAEADARIRMLQAESAAAWEMALAGRPFTATAQPAIPATALSEWRASEAEATARQALLVEEYDAALRLQRAHWQGLCEQLRRDVRASDERCEGLQGAVLSKQQMVEQLLDQVCWSFVCLYVCACAFLRLCI